MSGLVAGSLGFAWPDNLLPTLRNSVPLPGFLLCSGKQVPISSITYWCGGFARTIGGRAGPSWPGLAWPQACTTVLRRIIHRPCAPRAGSAPPCPLLPALSAPLALSIRCHIHRPTLLAPSCPALSPPGPPPCPMAASSGSWVTFSLQLLESLPCPLPLCLEWNRASFVTVSFKRSNLFRGVTWLLCQQLLVLAQLCCSRRSCQSRMRHPCPLVLGVLSGPLSAHG